MICSPRRFPFSATLCLGLVAWLAAPLRAQQDASGQFPAALLAGFHWRDVGPMRGGRSYGVAGVPSQPNTFYFGSVGGGVWKTENAGRTWFPIADQGIPIGSIGAIAVAQSNPNVIYVGTGEPDIRSQHSYGIGVFKSTDAGKTWKQIGLEKTEHIGKIVIDPADPDRVYVAALGSAYQANADRGVYRSTDGGAHWQKVLFKQSDPENVGAVDLALDPKNPRALYASLWATRRPPWAVYAPSNMPGSGLYKSSDGGDTWKQLSEGLPNDGFVGKIGISVSASNPNRVWIVLDDTGSSVARPNNPAAAAALANSGPSSKPAGGVYVSDDAGETWRLVNSEVRLWGRGWYFEQITVDPANPDSAYVTNTATYRTTDLGKTWIPVKGSPGGDDYHQIWVNPSDPSRMVLSSDQGTVVSVDDAKTWTTWYNQPTAEIYHVAADNRFPYWLVGAQQDSGGVGVSSLGREGYLNFRNWEPTCLAGESMTVVPDPDPKQGNILYGAGAGRCDQTINVAASLGGSLPPPDPGDPDRRTWTLPEVFSRADEALYYSNQFVFRSRDRGKNWEKISPDLARVNPKLPANLDPVTAKDIDQQMKDRFGVVYTISPSPIQATTVWAGTDDGLIYVTNDDGKTWNDLTPPPMTAWSKVSQVEAGHFDAQTAYASVDRHRLADDKPYIYRTHDGGKTWQNVVAGIPDGAYVNSVKEDPQQKGLLYAATELRVYVSFNDGDQWQSLQNDMPVTSIRDLVIHGDDLDIATHGRGFWVMDQMTALREIAARGTEIAAKDAYLFKPGETIAVRQGSTNGTPLPHEEPQELNPPAGVLAYYWLKSAPKGPIELELVNSTGKVSACVASDTPVKPVDTESINVQAIWEEPTLPPSAAIGMHRAPVNPSAPRFAYGRTAQAPPNDFCTPPEASQPPSRAGRANPNGPFREPPRLQPGEYQLRLTVDGQTYTQPVTVKPDPRGEPVDNSNADMGNRS